MPFMSDQFDNAQRLVDLGLGVRLDPFEFEDQQLIDAIDNLLNDKKLQQKLKVAAERIAAANSKEAVVIKIEQWLDEQTKSE